MAITKAPEGTKITNSGSDEKGWGEILGLAGVNKVKDSFPGLAGLCPMQRACVC